MPWQPISAMPHLALEKGACEVVAAEQVIGAAEHGDGAADDEVPRRVRRAGVGPLHSHAFQQLPLDRGLHSFTLQLNLSRV